MTIRTKTIGRMPQNKSEWDPNYVNPGTGQRGYGQKFRVFQYGCELESKIENNTYEPFNWDGDQTFVLDVAHWELCSGNPKVWAAGNPKPATTGTTGDYPYNGMGRVVIPKNMVNIAEQGDPENIINLLTQDAFEDSEGNPLTNTVFVIQYDFVLGEDITVPANCVLEFDGGSISGAYTLTGQDTKIISAPVGIFGSTLQLAGTFNTLKLEWFGIISSNSNNTSLFNSIKSRIDFYTIQSFEFVSDITFSANDIILPRRMKLNGNNNKLIFTSTSGRACLIVSETNSLSNIIFNADSTFNGAVIEDNTSYRDGEYPVCQLRMSGITIIGTYRDLHDYNLIGIRCVCTNNHERGTDGYNYITTNFSESLIIQWVKRGIEILLDNVDVTGGEYAWMNDFCFNYTFIQCSETAVKIDNRDSSTQNPTESSGCVCFGDLYLQPCLSGNTKLIMLYSAEVDIKNLWPWDCNCVGELRNNTKLVLEHMGISFQNQSSITEGSETYSLLSGFKIYDTSKVLHNDVYSAPIKWDTYNPASGSQHTRMKVSERGIGVVHGGDSFPVGLYSDTTLKTHTFIKPASGSVNEIFEDKIARRDGITTIGHANANYAIANHWLGYSWDGLAQCFAGIRNTREFNIRISSQDYTSNACNKVTYTPYIDTNKTIPLLSKLSFERVVGVMSANENIAKIVGVEVSGYSIIIYVETKQLSTEKIPVRFYLEFDNVVTYTKKPTIDDIDIQIQDELTYLPSESSSTIEIAYRTSASYASKPSTPPYVGFMYFATDLGKPIYWTGDTSKGDNGWVDANGNNPSQS